MPAQPQITQTNLKVWTNRHNTYKQPIDNLFDIANGDTGNIVDRYNATTASIQTLIGKAIQEKKSLRALGGGWSFSKVATTDGWMLNTKKLNMLFPIKNPQNISSQYPGRKDQLLVAILSRN
jgi:FAD/FMN-containing dehydrogenase